MTHKQNPEAVEAAAAAFERLPDGTEFRERLKVLPEYGEPLVTTPSELATAMLAAAEPFMRAEWERELVEGGAYTAGGEVARRHRLGLAYDEDGLEVQQEPLPEYLCSADMIASLGCVRAALTAMKEKD